MIMEVKLRFAWHTHLRYQFAGSQSVNCRIIAVYHMEYHAVIRLIFMVTMAMPVTCRHMYLHAPCPQLSSDLYFGIEEVGTGIGVDTAGINDSYLLSVDSVEVMLTPQTVLPDIVHEFFHGSGSIIIGVSRRVMGEIW